MKKGGGSESTIIIGPSKSVLVYALHSLEYVLGLVRFRVFMQKKYYLFFEQTLKIIEKNSTYYFQEFCFVKHITKIFTS